MCWTPEPHQPSPQVTTITSISSMITYTQFKALIEASIQSGLGMNWHEEAEWFISTEEQEIAEGEREGGRQSKLKASKQTQEEMEKNEVSVHIRFIYFTQFHTTLSY